MNALKLGTFTLTLFLSAALMFGLQPMVGKMLLPLVGGTPSGWIVAMAFFQLMLLAGYFLAHYLSKFTPTQHALLYLGVLVVGLISLPISLNSNVDIINGGYHASITVLLLLTMAVSLPFIAISATNSTIQRLFTITGHKSAEDPYFLYAASNIGSFTGLFAYPFLVEPVFTLTQQSNMWLGGYLVLIGFSLVCLGMSHKKSKGKKKTTTKKKTKENKVSASWEQRLEWIALSFIPSALMLAVTTHITTDVFSAPLIWVVPLSIYLLTFVIAFSKKQIVSYDYILRVQPALCAIGFTIALFSGNEIFVSFTAMGLHVFIFTIVALMCHMRLAHKRPENNLLTEFYLTLAIGGALGGIVNAFIAPVVFDSLYEYPMLLIAASLFNDKLKTKITQNHYFAFGLALLLMVFYATVVSGIDHDGLEVGIVFACVALITFHPKVAFTSTLIVFLAFVIAVAQDTDIKTARNFYGVIKVYDRPLQYDKDTEVTARYMQHGTTRHGFQIVEPKEYRQTRTSYYYDGGPFSMAINYANPKNMAVIGLGSGTLTCYTHKKRKVTFFEVDEEVVNMAKKHFTFLDDCGRAEMPEIIVGDARIELQKYNKEKFDLIVLDAFSSDTIPTHLVTQEAFKIYLEKLTKNGVILMHISNRYFDFEEAFTATIESLGLHSVFIHKDLEGLPLYAKRSKMMVVTNKKRSLKPLLRQGWSKVDVPEGTRPWTDDYTDLLHSLKYIELR